MEMGDRQVVVIIGANRGIGAQLTRRFLNRGSVVYASYRPSAKGDASVQWLRDSGASLMEVDVADEESIAHAAEQFQGHHVDILINVAGIYNLWDDKPFHDQTGEDLMLFFKVNVVGPFLTSKYFLPHLMRGKLAKIINVSSDMASMADNTGGNACYRISKTALNQLTTTQSLDLAKTDSTSHVKTLAVHPGFVATKMTGFYGEDDMDQCMSSLVSVIERFGQPGEEEKLKNGGYYRWNGEPMNY